MGEDWGKLIVAKGIKKLPKVQNIAQSGHTACKPWLLYNMDHSGLFPIQLSQLHTYLLDDIQYVCGCASCLYYVSNACQRMWNWNKIRLLWKRMYKGPFYTYFLRWNSLCCI